VPLGEHDPRGPNVQIVATDAPRPLVSFGMQHTSDIACVACPHVWPLLQRVQALSNLQTVNTRKNLEKNFKSNVGKMI
jgi:hypothetical protein